MNTWKKKLETHLAHANRGVAEDAHIIDYLSDEAREDFREISISDLAALEHPFLPLSFYDAGNDLRILTAPLSQTLVDGATGSGKTQTLVLNMLSFYALLPADSKPNLFVYDPKGENLRLMGEMLKESGYKLINLDLKKPHRGVHYNPLSDLFDRHIEAMRTRDLIQNGGIGTLYRGQSYESTEEAQGAAMERITELDVYTHQAMEELIELLLPIGQEKDPMWTHGGRMILRGIMDALMYYGYLGLISREDFTLGNVAAIASSQAEHLSAFLHTAAHIPSVAATLAGQIDLKAQVTRDGYTSTLRTAIGDITSPTVRILTDTNDLNLGDIAEGREPYAIFYGTNMVSHSGDAIASMLINNLISTCMATADANDGKLPRDFIFVLDEFANMRKLPNFSTKISLLRSYRVYLFMVVQSHSQLVQVYDEETTQIIMDNATTHYHLGSPDYDTKERFIRSLGKKSVYQTSASIANDGSLNFNVTLQETPLLHPSDLDRLRLGECFVRVSRHLPLRTFLIPHFMREDLASVPYKSHPRYRPNTRETLTIENLFKWFVIRLQRAYPRMQLHDFTTKYGDIPSKLLAMVPPFSGEFGGGLSEAERNALRLSPEGGNGMDNSIIRGTVTTAPPADETNPPIDTHTSSADTYADEKPEVTAPAPVAVADAEPEEEVDSFEALFKAAMRDLQNQTPAEETSPDASAGEPLDEAVDEAVDETSDDTVGDADDTVGDTDGEPDEGTDDDTVGDADGESDDTDDA